MSNFNSLILVALIFLLHSCKSQPTVEEILVGDCFWDIYDKRYSKEPTTCWRFYDKKRCEYFSYIYDDKIQRTKFVARYNDDDNVRPDNWFVDGDTLRARGSAFKIVNFKKDTVILATLNSSDTVLLTKNCRSVMNNVRNQK